MAEHTPAHRRPGRPLAAGRSSHPRRRGLLIATVTGAVMVVGLGLLSGGSGSRSPGRLSLAAADRGAAVGGSSRWSVVPVGINGRSRSSLSRTGKTARSSLAAHHSSGAKSSLATASGTGRALFGGSGPLVAQQPKLGRKLAIVRIYAKIGNTFPQREETTLMAAGTTLLVSIDTGGPSYASIAAGHYDATIRAYLVAMNKAAIRYHLHAMYASFEHEPDNPGHKRFGSDAEFVRAWDHVHQLARSAHVDWNDGGRLHWVFIMIHSSYPHSWVSKYWPGSAEVDILGVDGYNSSGCSASNQPRKGVSPAWLFDPALSFAATHGRLPVFISEWGSDTTPGAIQPSFIHQMTTYVTAHSTIRGAMYWDYAGPDCSYRVDGHPASLAALRAMGHSSVMQATAS